MNGMQTSKKIGFTGKLSQSSHFTLLFVGYPTSQHLIPPPPNVMVPSWTSKDILKRNTKLALWYHNLPSNILVSLNGWIMKIYTSNDRISYGTQNHVRCSKLPKDSIFNMGNTWEISANRKSSTPPFPLFAISADWTKWYSTKGK